MTDIGLKDLIKCISGLNTDAQSTREIMDLLGVSFRLPQEMTEATTDGLTSDPGEGPKTTRSERHPERPKEPRRPPDRDQAAIASDLVATGDAGNERIQQRLRDAKSLKRDSSENLAPPRFRPLLVEGWTRGVVKAALSTPETGDAIDIAQLIDIASSAKPFSRLPYQKSPGLRRGVQVLVDRGEAMSLFRRDQEWLIKQLNDIVGKPRVELAFYRGCPSNGIRRPRELPVQPYVPPPAGTPVLLLSGLSIEAAGRVPLSSGIETWERFARDVNAAGCPLVALVPYRQSAWPKRLSKGTSRIICIPWDNCTSATSVRSLVGPWHEVDL